MTTTVVNANAKMTVIAPHPILFEHSVYLVVTLVNPTRVLTNKTAIAVLSATNHKPTNNLTWRRSRDWTLTFTVFLTSRGSYWDENVSHVGRVMDVMLIRISTHIHGQTIILYTQ